MRRVTAALLLVSALSSCRNSHPAMSFYFWRTTFQLSAEEKAALQTNHVRKLYVRYFDVALHGETPAPVSPVVFNGSSDSLHRIEIVPVVYIKNEVMMPSKISSSALPGLAHKVVAYINQIDSTYHIRCTEIQLDCDWTVSSMENYFEFVDEVKKESGKIISATIRLHQVKYFRHNGVPPVDHGVLMYYNMGPISSVQGNSIYDADIASHYTESLKSYPLPLNVAFPMFSWGIHIRGNKVLGLINKTDRDVFANDARFAMKQPPFFEVTEDAIKLGRYFQKGDRIKVESVSADDLKEMAEEVSSQLERSPDEIIFYDLDSFNLKHYEQEENIFEEVCDAF